MNAAVGAVAAEWTMQGVWLSSTRRDRLWRSGMMQIQGPHRAIIGPRPDNDGMNASSISICRELRTRVPNVGRSWRPARPIKQARQEPRSSCPIRPSL